MLHALPTDFRVECIENSVLLRSQFDGSLYVITVHPHDPLVFIPDLKHDFVLSVHDPAVRGLPGAAHSVQSSLLLGELGDLLCRHLHHNGTFIMHNDAGTLTYHTGMKQGGLLYRVACEEKPDENGATAAFVVSVDKKECFRDEKRMHRYPLKEILGDDLRVVVYG